MRIFINLAKRITTAGVSSSFRLLGRKYQPALSLSKGELGGCSRYALKRATRTDFGLESLVYGNKVFRCVCPGLCFALLMLSNQGFSQTTTSNYTTTQTVVFGAGVTSVNVSMWGGGGGGSAGGGVEYSGALNEIFTYYTGAGNVIKLRILTSVGLQLLGLPI